MFKKHIVNLLTRRSEILVFEGGTKVVDDGQCEPFPRKDAFDVTADRLVARKDQRQSVLAAKSRTRTRGCDEFCDFHDLLAIAAIGAA